MRSLRAVAQCGAAQRIEGPAQSGGVQLVHRPAVEPDVLVCRARCADAQGRPPGGGLEVSLCAPPHGAGCGCARAVFAPSVSGMPAYDAKSAGRPTLGLWSVCGSTRPPTRPPASCPLVTMTVVPHRPSPPLRQPPAPATVDQGAFQMIRAGRVNVRRLPAFGRAPGHTTQDGHRLRGERRRPCGSAPIQSISTRQPSFPSQVRTAI